VLAHPISNEFLLWAELSALWAAASYGVVADPLRDETEQFQSQRWRATLAIRCVLMMVILFLKSHSFILTGCVVLLCAIHPLLRYWISFKQLAEFECAAIIVAIGLMWIVIKHWHLMSQWSVVRLSMSAEHISALAIVAATFLVIERGGTYIVKGCLKKADTLPHLAADGSDQKIDEAEVNRGRLIGNLERLVLVLVAAAGSYAALGFLVAAKGLIRSEEFQNRDFTEYFLVGSFSSVLVALSAGLILRFVLLSLWPDLLSLNMQS
jgi:hypothetical protein